MTFNRLLFSWLLIYPRDGCGFGTIIVFSVDKKYSFLKLCVMKKFMIIAVIFAGSLFAPQTADAQIDIRVNIGMQPIWGPAGFEYVEYYYIPELDIYYYVPGRQFIYMVNGRWVARKKLPPYYRNFDFYRARLIVINARTPYLQHNYYKRKYANYWDHRPYITIRDTRDPRFYANRNHPRYREYVNYRNSRDHDRSRWDRSDDRDRNNRQNVEKRENSNIERSSAEVSRERDSRQSSVRERDSRQRSSREQSSRQQNSRQEAGRPTR